MPAPALQLDLPDPEPAGIWPWLVALFAGSALVLALGDRIEHITGSIERQALARVADAGAGAERVEVGIDGRDVTLYGELDPGTDRTALVADVAAIDGVRSVRDELDVVDPLTRAEAARSHFLDGLAAIDTSAVAFEPGSAEFTRASEAPLAALLELLRANPPFRVRVAGHTDGTGRAEANLRLSRERALAVATYLETRGVDPTRIIAQGYGATQPVADDATAAGRARNRRIEIDYVD